MAYNVFDYSCQFWLFINGLPIMCLIIVVNNVHTTLFQKKSSWSNQGSEDGKLQVLKDGFLS